MPEDETPRFSLDEIESALANAGFESDAQKTALNALQQYSQQRLEQNVTKEFRDQLLVFAAGVDFQRHDEEGRGIGWLDDHSGGVLAAFRDRPPADDFEKAVFDSATIIYIFTAGFSAIEIEHVSFLKSVGVNTDDLLATLKSRYIALSLTIAPDSSKENLEESYNERFARLQDFSDRSFGPHFAAITEPESQRLKEVIEQQAIELPPFGDEDDKDEDD